MLVVPHKTIQQHNENEEEKKKKKREGEKKRIISEKTKDNASTTLRDATAEIKTLSDTIVLVSASNIDVVSPLLDASILSVATRALILPIAVCSSLKATPLSIVAVERRS